jgi:hypothetical protein
MLAPVWVIVGTSAETSVPDGTVTATVCDVSEMVPSAAGLVNLNAVTALVLLGDVSPQPVNIIPKAVKRTPKNIRFICLLL